MIHIEAPLLAVWSAYLREVARQMDVEIMGPNEENADWRPGVDPLQKDGQDGQSEHHR